MEWITKEEIARRSTSPYEAFTVSILKYEQCLRASEKELREAFREGKIGLSVEWCGCCMYYGNENFDGNCRECSLHQHKVLGQSCCPEFYKMNDAYEYLSDSKNSFSVFQDSVRLLLCRLYQERDKLPKEEKKQKQEPLKDGDYGLFKFSDWANWVRAIVINNNFHYLEKAEDGCKTCSIPASHQFEKKGNLLDIFTDLEALKEPLEKAEFTDWHGDRLSIRRIDSGGCSGNSIELNITDTQYNTNRNFHFNLPLNQAPEFILKLRQVATAKRKDC